MLVRELMTRDVVTVSADATLRETVGELRDHSVGSVVVVDGDGAPIGIVTESDALAAAHETDDPLSALRVGDLSHRPVVTTEPDRSVTHLVRRMVDEDIKKVPVLDDLDIVGIVTLTDIVWELSELRSEAADLATPPNGWGPN
ncbi:CBS domain-containing protein [Halapricum sp. CBA1109]|uniref:CBS domain-containing protein n=1 Tax=Halapricum sp. CBA1109 TaxID=2668068 RepID=UPI0012FAB78A|nr:CBS domain-containing protein [Halapricum sp. CBA1109]MUV89241.1 CBS domain-containing protein [Halapricum sp. CBA1109]